MPASSRPQFREEPEKLNPITHILTDPSLKCGDLPKMEELIDCRDIMLCSICDDNMVTQKLYDVYCCRDCSKWLSNIIINRLEIPAETCVRKRDPFVGWMRRRCQNCLYCRRKKYAEEAVKRRGDFHWFVAFDLLSSARSHVSFFIRLQTRETRSSRSQRVRTLTCS